MKAFMSITEAAEFLGVSRRTVWEAVRRREIKGMQIHRKWLLRKEALENLCIQKEGCENGSERS